MNNHKEAMPHQFHAMSNKTLGDYFVGDGNSSVPEALEMLARNLNGSCTPIVLLGDDQTGKTHLAHAFAHLVEESKPGVAIAAMNAQKLGDSPTREWRKGFRRAVLESDLLILEDAHLIGHSRSLLRRFLWALGKRAEADLPVFLTCNPEHEGGASLVEEVKNRFQKTLTIALERPSFPDLCEILRKKARRYDVSLAEDLIHLLVAWSGKDIVEMESNLIRMNAMARLLDVKPDLEMLQEFLASNLAERLSS